MTRPFNPLMYQGLTPEEFLPKARTTMDARIINIALSDGSYIDVISPKYVYTLEDKILETQKQNAILNERLNSHDGEIKRLKAAIKKLEAMLR